MGRYKTWTLHSGVDYALDHRLDCGLDFGLDFGLDSRIYELAWPSHRRFLIAYGLVPRVRIIQIPMHFFSMA